MNDWLQVMCNFKIYRGGWAVLGVYRFVGNLLLCYLFQFLDIQGG